MRSIYIYTVRNLLYYYIIRLLQTEQIPPRIYTSINSQISSKGPLELVLLRNAYVYHNALGCCRDTSSPLSWVRLTRLRPCKPIIAAYHGTASLKVISAKVFLQRMQYDLPDYSNTWVIIKWKKEVSIVVSTTKIRVKQWLRTIFAPSYLRHHMYVIKSNALHKA